MLDDDKPEPFAFMSRDARGWERAWGEIAKRCGDTVCRCPETGEAWQYMGTTLRDGVPVRHCFRHRSLNGQPRSLSVDAMPDDLLPAEGAPPPDGHAVARGDWNRCPRCNNLVDADDVHDGSEVRCHGCKLTLVCTALTDGTWTLVEAEEEPPSDPLTPPPAAPPEQRVACAHRLGDRDHQNGGRWRCRTCGELEGDDCAPPERAPAELTDDRLDELDRLAREAAERANKATAGPWRAERGCVLPPTDAERGPVKALLEPEILIAAGTAGECVANSVFAAAAREDVPVLSAALQDATAEIRRLREALSEEWVERKEAQAARDEAVAEVRRLRAMNERYAVQNTRLMEMLLPLSRAVRWLFGRGPR